MKSERGFRKGISADMTLKLLRIVVLLITLALIAVIVPVCGCSSKNTTTKNTAPATESQDTAPQPQSTTPSNSAGSKSEAALAQAKAEGKPVLLKFGSGTCIPCREIEENIDEIKPDYEGKVAFVIVDVYNPQEQNLTDQYGIRTIPTTYFLGKDSSIVNKVSGVMEPDQLKQQLDAML